MIDTRAKRESTTKIILPFYAQTIDPSGTVDRPGSLWLYNGLGASTAVASIVHALTWAVESTKILLYTVASTKTLTLEVESTKTLALEVQ